MSDTLTMIAAVGAATAAFLYILGLIRKGFRAFERIESLTTSTASTVDRELTTNTGSSMKDQVGTLPHQVALLRRQIERVGEQAYRAVAVSQATHQLLDEHIQHAETDRQALHDQIDEHIEHHEGNDPT